MDKKINQEGITIKKDKNFSEWYQQVIDKADIVDIRYNVKGFIVIKSWGAMIIEEIYSLFEKELQKKGHKPVFFPTVIPEENFKMESEHVEGFTPQVFWLEKTQGKEKLALRPTSETAFYKLYSLWIRSHRDLPLKLYQRANIFRNETKATRPLIRAREFYWIEAHNCFATKKQAEEQVQEDIQITEKIMHQQLGIPFLPMKRPKWDTFAGAEYTVGSDVLMPDGKLIQQPSTHLLGQNFSKPFDIKFKNEKGEEEYVWQTCYGPAISRILASIISTHGDDNGLILPFCVSPIQTIIVPIFTKENKEKIIKESEKIKNILEKEGVKVEIDCSDKRPGEKYYEWELKGVPFRIEVGEKEIKEKKVILFYRDTKKKEKVSIKDLKKIKEYGKELDKRILKKADDFLEKNITDCKNKEELELIMSSGGLARVNFCSTKKEGEKCAEYIEKKINAEVRGTIASKQEEANGKCIFCGKEAKEIVYIGKSY